MTRHEWTIGSGGLTTSTLDRIGEVVQGFKVTAGTGYWDTEREMNQTITLDGPTQSQLNQVALIIVNATRNMGDEAVWYAAWEIEGTVIWT